MKQEVNTKSTLYQVYFLSIYEVQVHEHSICICTKAIYIHINAIGSECQVGQSLWSSRGAGRRDASLLSSLTESLRSKRKETSRRDQRVFPPSQASRVWVQNKVDESKHEIHSQVDAITAGTASVVNLTAGEFPPGGTVQVQEVELMPGFSSSRALIRWFASLS